MHSPIGVSSSAVRSPGLNELPQMKFAEIHLGPIRQGQGDTVTKKSSTLVRGKITDDHPQKLKSPNNNKNASNGENKTNISNKAKSSIFPSNEPLFADVGKILEFQKETNYECSFSENQYMFTGQLKIQNIYPDTRRPLFFKVKTTAPEKFVVNQIIGFIPGGPEGIVKPKIIVRPDTVFWSVSHERFQVLVMLAPQQLLEQKALVSKMMSQGSQSVGLGCSITSKLHQLWNRFVSEGIHVEVHRVQCILSHSQLFSRSREFIHVPQPEHEKRNITNPNNNINNDNNKTSNNDERTKYDEQLRPSFKMTSPRSYEEDESNNQNLRQRSQIKIQQEKLIPPFETETHDKKVHVTSATTTTEDLYTEVEKRVVITCESFTCRMKTLERRMENLLHCTTLRFILIKKLLFITVLFLVIMTLLGYLIFIREDKLFSYYYYNDKKTSAESPLKNEQHDEYIEKPHCSSSTPVYIETPPTKQYASWNTYYM